MNSREMHESESAWIGLYPINWDVKPLKQCIEHRQGGDWGDDEITVESANKDNLVCIRVADFDFQHFGITKNKSFTVRSYDKQTIKKLKLQCGDILVEKSGGGEKKPVGRAVIFDASFEALYANFLERFRLTKNVLPKYFLYCWNTFYLQGHTRLYIKQTTGIQNLDFSKILANESILVPSLEEQSAISNFLDSKCEEIDALCDDIEKQIETLQEYKKSVITEAVTKGLDPNVEMKNSGVEWIGMIPKHWGTLSLQYLLSFSGSGTTPKGLDKLVCEDGNGINWLNTGDLTDSYIVNIPQKLKSEVMPQYSALRLYPSGSLVIAMYGATAGKLGILLEPSTTNQACCVLVPNKDLLNLKYLFYQLLAARSSLVSLSKGGGQPNISQETVRKFKVCFTELQEQSNIVNFLDEQCNIIDGAIEIKKSQLETLAQYKQSLIYEYVTGKKAVPANFQEVTSWQRL